MAQQNGRLNTDLDNMLTMGYHDGRKWFMYSMEQDGDNQTLGKTTDGATANTVIGLLKGLKNQLPTALTNGNLKVTVMNPLPQGTNKIGQVDVATLPALPTGANKIGRVEVEGLTLKAGGVIGVEVTNNPKEIAVNNFPNSFNIGNIPENQNVTITNEKVLGSQSVYGAVTVGTTATAIRVKEADLTGRHTITIVNVSETDIFVGYDANVTIENGLPIKAGQEREYKLNPKDPLTIYGIAATDAQVRVSEQK